MRDGVLGAPGGRVEAIIVALVGDLIEGAVSQGGKLPNGLCVSEQIRVV